MTPEVKAGPTKTMHEENGRRIHITQKKSVWVRSNIRLLEGNLTKRTGFANPETEVAVPSEDRRVFFLLTHKGRCEISEVKSQMNVPRFTEPERVGRHERPRDIGYRAICSS